MTAESIKKANEAGKGHAAHPPAHAPAHAPAKGAAGHPPAAPAPKGPPGKEVHLNKPVQKSHIADEEPEGGPPPKPDGSWLVRMTTPKAIGLVVGLLACMGAVAAATAWYDTVKAAAAFRGRLGQAVVRQAELHRADGQTYQEIALVDSVRRCVSATLADTDWAIRSGLAEATVETIGATAETRCLETTLTEAARDFVIAREAARVAPDDAAKQAEANRRSDTIRFVVTFAKLKGYAVPAEFKAYATDITILDRFGGSEGVKPPSEPVAQPIWKQ